jgi:lysine N6-hydroxylase
LRKQDVLYKGIEIYDALYLKGLEQDVSSIKLHTNCELTDVSSNGNNISLQLHHTAHEKVFEHETNALVLATGYQTVVPSFLDSIKERINWMEEGSYNIARNYSVDRTGKRIFVQNAELHSHGFSAPDLGMGPYRNATILNSIRGYEYYLLEKKIAFQRFGIIEV